MAISYRIGTTLMIVAACSKAKGYESCCPRRRYSEIYNAGDEVGITTNCKYSAVNITCCAVHSKHIYFFGKSTIFLN